MGNIDTLADDLMQTFYNGVDGITADCMAIAKETAEEYKDALKRSSPKDTGDYADGWTVRKSGQGYIVYNKNRPNIEMPLEYGHIAIRGRNAGKRVGQRQHIYKNADRYRNMYYNQCLKRAGRSGK